MLEKFWARRANRYLMAVLGASVLAAGGDSEKTGDNLQVALPAVALACSVANGEAVSYLVRFAAVQAVVHTSKAGLEGNWINQRPSGSPGGFPSGHTSAAAFGASSLVYSCARVNPFVSGLAVIGAGTVGVSRIEAGAHFLYQVVAGAFLGWAGERATFLARLLSLWWRLRSRRPFRLGLTGGGISRAG